MRLEHIKDLREKARRLPGDPGVYLMRDGAGEIIYVGKAKALRSRVGSYFRSIEKHQEKTLRLVHAVRDFETIVTASEFEALVLECSMIKQYQPKYNILLKDDKGYHYVHISGDEYPRVSAEKQRTSGGGRWIGPYTSSFVVSQTVDEVNKAFMLPTCKRKFPEDFGKARPCLNYHIEQCIGLCRGKTSKEEFGEIIEQAQQFITRGATDTMELLGARMEAASEALDFEKAAFYRDRIKAVKKMAELQNVVFTKSTEDQDVIALLQNAKESCAALLKIRSQRLVDKQTFQLGQVESLDSARADFILSYYGQAGADIPGVILIDGSCDDAELIERYLREHRGRKAVLHQPSRGDGLRLVKMATANAAQHLAHRIERTGRELAALDELARLLGLSSPPQYIEAYDISNYGEQTVVGGMVVFENGRPLKAAYKKFNMKSIDGQDDYGAMREMLFRRFVRYEEHKEEGNGFGRLPDLILIDGGKGHLSAAQPVLVGLGLDIPIFGMVKDSKHKTRAIAGNGGEIAISASRSAFALVSGIQQEVHRYAITHMRQRHKKSGFALRLTQVEGVGEKRAVSLLKHFKTQKSLSAATPEELAKVPGMTAKTAQAVYDFLHSVES